MNQYEDTLLAGWEDVYKKAQLTLWVLLALKESEKHMAEVKEFVGQITSWLLIPDDKSMYRSLRRLVSGDVIEFRLQAAKGGPDRKVYRLTTHGVEVLSAFLQRNIIDVYYNSRVKNLIKKDSHEPTTN